MLVSENKDHSLVISIEPIQRSLAIRIEGYDVEAVWVLNLLLNPFCPRFLSPHPAIRDHGVQT